MAETETNTNETVDNKKLSEKIALLKQYKDAIVALCNWQEDYMDRIDSLVVAWNSVAVLVEKSTAEASDNLLHWVLRHTLHLMLVGEWLSLPEKKREIIRQKIEESIPKLSNSPNSIYRCQYILDNMDNPWGDERLLNVLHGESSTINEADLEFLTCERGCMIVLRLQKLCETNCDVMAFTWCSKSLLALRAVDVEHSLKKSTSVRQLLFIFDVYLGLLHKFGDVHRIIEEVRHLTLENGLQLIRRNISCEIDGARLSKYRSRVANLAADVLAANIMLEPLTKDNENYYSEIIREWLTLQKTAPILEFRIMVRKVFMTATSKEHLYLACAIFKELNVTEWRPLQLELFIRAVTMDLNKMEVLKSENDCNEHILLQHEVDLSYRYLELADILKSYILLAQECYLTAFSLHPTDGNFSLIKQISINTGKLEINKNNIKLNDPTTTPSPITGDSNIDVNIAQKPFPHSLLAEPSPTAIQTSALNLTRTDGTASSPILLQGNSSEIIPPQKRKSTLDVLHSILGNKLLQAPGYDPMKAPSYILDSIETIDIPDHIRMDLSVLLSSPRLKILSWILPWPELESNCLTLLQGDSKMEMIRKSLAVANDHLQFLKLDYNQFKHLPEGDVPGIEKGYEIYSIDDDEGNTSTSSSSTSSSSSSSSSSDSLYGEAPRKRKTKGRKRKTTNKAKREKIKKMPKDFQNTIDEAVETQINNHLATFAATVPCTSEKAREYEDALRAWYLQQMQSYTGQQQVAASGTNVAYQPNQVIADQKAMPPPTALLSSIIQKGNAIKKSKRISKKRDKLLVGDNAHNLPGTTINPIAVQAYLQNIAGPITFSEQENSSQNNNLNLSYQSPIKRPKGRPRKNPPNKVDKKPLNGDTQKCLRNTVSLDSHLDSNLDVKRISFHGIFPKAKPNFNISVCIQTTKYDNMDIDDSSRTKSSPEVFNYRPYVENEDLEISNKEKDNENIIDDPNKFESKDSSKNDEEDTNSVSTGDKEFVENFRPRDHEIVIEKDLSSINTVESPPPAESSNNETIVSQDPESQDNCHINLDQKENNVNIEEKIDEHLNCSKENNEKETIAPNTITKESKDKKDAEEQQEGVANTDPLTRYEVSDEIEQYISMLRQESTEPTIENNTQEKDSNDIIDMLLDLEENKRNAGRRETNENLSKGKANKSASKDDGKEKLSETEDEKESVEDFQTDDKESVEDLQADEEESVEDLQADEEESVEDLQADEKESVEDLQTDEKESVVDLQTDEESVVDLQTDEKEFVEELQTDEKESVVDLQTDEESVVDLQSDEKESVEELQTDEKESVVDLQTDEESVVDLQTDEKESVEELQTDEKESVEELQTDGKISESNVVMISTDGDTLEKVSEEDDGNSIEIIEDIVAKENPSDTFSQDDEKSNESNKEPNSKEITEEVLEHDAKQDNIEYEQNTLTDDDSLPLAKLKKSEYSAIISDSEIYSSEKSSKSIIKPNSPSNESNSNSSSKRESNLMENDSELTSTSSEDEKIEKFGSEKKEKKPQFILVYTSGTNTIKISKEKSHTTENDLPEASSSSVSDTDEENESLDQTCNGDDRIEADALDQNSNDSYSNKDDQTNITSEDAEENIAGQRASSSITTSEEQNSIDSKTQNTVNESSSSHSVTNEEVSLTATENNKIEHESSENRTIQSKTVSSSTDTSKSKTKTFDNYNESIPIESRLIRCSNNIPQLILEKLDNITLLKYKQSILVDRYVVSSPTVRLKRLNPEMTPPKYEDMRKSARMNSILKEKRKSHGEYNSRCLSDNEDYTPRNKLIQPLRIIRNLRRTTSSYKKLPPSICLTDAAEIAHNRSNNLEMFQVSSDDELIADFVEKKRYQKQNASINNIPNESSDTSGDTNRTSSASSCNTTSNNNLKRQRTPSDSESNIVKNAKRSYMFDIYSVIVKSDFKLSENLFSYKKSVGNYARESHDLLLDRGAKLVLGDLKKTEVEKDRCIHQILHDTLSFLLPKILIRRGQKNSNNNGKDIKNFRKACRQTLNLISLKKCGCKKVRDDIERDKINKSYINDKLSYLLASDNDKDKKYHNIDDRYAKLPAYSRLRNYIQSQALGFTPYHHQIQSQIVDSKFNDTRPNNNSNNNANNTSLLTNVPGFKTLEHFTAPSYHCLPVVRIVHSTMPIDDINNSTGTDITTQTEGVINDNVCQDQNSTYVATAQKPTPVVQKFFCTTRSGNLQENFVQQSFASKSLSSLVNQQTIPTTKLIKMENLNKDVNNKSKVESSNIVIVECHNDRLIAATKSNVNVSNERSNGHERIVTNLLITSGGSGDSHSHIENNKLDVCKILTNTKSQQQQNLQILQNANNKMGGSSQHIKLTENINSNNKILPLQLIYKSDGSVLQLTPLPTTNGLQNIDIKKDVKTISLVKTDIKSVSDMSVISARSVYEENYAKFIQTSKQAHITPSLVRTIVHNAQPKDFLINTSSLPEFNQAFGGRSVYSDTTTEQVLQVLSSAGKTKQTNVGLIDAKSDTVQTSNKINDISNSKKSASQGLLYATKQISTSTTSIVPSITASLSAADSSSDIQKSIGSIITKNKLKTNAATSRIVAASAIVCSKADISKSNQPIKIIQANDVVSVNNATITSDKSTIINPLQLSIPTSTSAGVVSNYVQTRFVRPIFQLAPNILPCRGIPSSQQIILNSPRIASLAGTTSTGVCLENLLVSTAGSSLNATTSKTKRTTVPQSISSSSSSSSSTMTSSAVPIVTSSNGNEPISRQFKNKPESPELVDNSTLEQLREFDLVLEQVKGRSTSGSLTPSSSSVALNVTQTYNNTTDTSKGNNSVILTNSSQVNVINQTNICNNRSVIDSIEKRERSEEENQQSVLQKVNWTLLQKSPFVVVTNSFPTSNDTITKTLSKQAFVNVVGDDIINQNCDGPTSKSISDIDLNKILSNNNKQPKQNTNKTPASQTISSSSSSSSSSSFAQKLPKPQEDEQTVQRIYDILAEYAEQLRNSPDLNNKPAPRRRSNPMNTSGSGNKKRKMSLQKRSESGSGMCTDYDPATYDSEEDSSCGTSSINNRSPLHEILPPSEIIHHTSPQQFFGRQRLIKTEMDGFYALVDDSSLKSSPNNSTTTTIVNFCKQQQSSPPGTSSSTTSSSSSITTNIANRTNVINVDVAQQTSSNNQHKQCPPATTTTVLLPSKYLVPLNVVKSEPGDIVSCAVPTQLISSPTGGNDSTTFAIKSRSGKTTNIVTKCHQSIEPFSSKNFKQISLQSVRHPVAYIQTEPISSSSSSTLSSSSSATTSTKITNNYQKTAILFHTQPAGIATNPNSTIKAQIIENLPQKNHIKIVEVSAIKNIIASSSDVGGAVDDWRHPNNNINNKVLTISSSHIKQNLQNNKIQDNGQNNVITKKVSVRDAVTQSTYETAIVSPIIKQLTDNISSSTQSKGIPTKLPQTYLLSLGPSSSSLASTTNAISAANIAPYRNIAGNNNNNNNNMKTFENIKNNLRLESYRNTSSRILSQLNEGRKLAIDNFQKSISDECEDLGVDEPSTSELFPEADLLFDAQLNIFDQNTQEELGVGGNSASVSNNNESFIKKPSSVIHNNNNHNNIDEKRIFTKDKQQQRQQQHSKIILNGSSPATVIFKNGINAKYRMIDPIIKTKSVQPTSSSSLLPATSDNLIDVSDNNIQDCLTWSTTNLLNKDNTNYQHKLQQSSKICNFVIQHTSFKNNIINNNNNQEKSLMSATSSTTASSSSFTTTTTTSPVSTKKIITRTSPALLSPATLNTDHWSYIANNNAHDNLNNNIKGSNDDENFEEQKSMTTAFPNARKRRITTTTTRINTPSSNRKQINALFYKTSLPQITTTTTTKTAETTATSSTTGIREPITNTITSRSILTPATITVSEPKSIIIQHSSQNQDHHQHHRQYLNTSSSQTIISPIITTTGRGFSVPTSASSNLRDKVTNKKFVCAIQQLSPVNKKVRCIKTTTTTTTPSDGGSPNQKLTVKTMTTNNNIISSGTRRNQAIGDDIAKQMLTGSSKLVEHQPIIFCTNNNNNNSSITSKESMSAFFTTTGGNFTAHQNSTVGGGNNALAKCGGGAASNNSVGNEGIFIGLSGHTSSKRMIITNRTFKANNKR